MGSKVKEIMDGAARAEAAKQAQTLKYEAFAKQEQMRRLARESLDWLAENDPVWALNICFDIETKITK